MTRADLAREVSAILGVEVVAYPTNYGTYFGVSSGGGFSLGHKSKASAEHIAAHFKAAFPVPQSPFASRETSLWQP